MRRTGTLPWLTVATLAAPILAAPASAAPLALYDNAREPAGLAPLTPNLPCGEFAVACGPSSGAAAAVKAQAKALPFDYGLEVSGVVGGGRGGGFSGEAVAGWIKPKDIPVTIQFAFQRFQPLGRGGLP